MLGDITYSKIRNIIPGISVFIGHAFRANQYLFFLLNAACLAEKATNTNLMKILFAITSMDYLTSGGQCVSCVHE
jgi:hypothetical protein